MPGTYSATSTAGIPIVYKGFHGTSTHRLPVPATMTDAPGRQVGVQHQEIYTQHHRRALTSCIS